MFWFSFIKIWKSRYKAWMLMFKTKTKPEQKNHHVYLCNFKIQTDRYQAKII